MTPFSDAIAWRSIEPGFSEGRISPDWGQGRATFGGLVSAVALHQMMQLVENGRAPRALTVTFSAPLLPDGSPARCRTSVLRSGKAISQLEARIEQGEQQCCIAQGVFGATRESSATVAPRQPPELSPIEQAMRIPYVEGLSPVFLRHVGLHWASGNLPGSGSAITPIGGYCELNDGGRASVACVVTALLDAWPTPFFAALQPPFRASTAQWMLDFFTDLLSYEPQAPFRYSCEVIAASGGHVQQEAWLWDARDRALARAVQLIEVFG